MINDVFFLLICFFIMVKYFEIVDVDICMVIIVMFVKKCKFERMKFNVVC